MLPRPLKEPRIEARVFISHAIPFDSAARNAIVTRSLLEPSRLTVCGWSASREDFGEDWQSETSRQIRDCDVVVALVGAFTGLDPDVRAEVEIARELGRPVLAAGIGVVESPPFGLPVLLPFDDVDGLIDGIRAAAAAKHFHITADPGAPAPALERAFLWLKRRVEEWRANGVLWLPDTAYLRGPLTDALGWRLTSVLESEGRLPLGGGVAMYCCVSDQPPLRPFGPAASIEPHTTRLATLAALPGPTLIASGSPEVLATWRAMTGSAGPAPEVFGRPPAPRVSRAAGTALAVKVGHQ